MATLEKIDNRMGGGIEKILVHDGKVGATSGWTVRAAADAWLSTVAQSQTAATLVLPIPGLKRGDAIVGWHLIGQIESGGNTVTVDSALNRHDAVAADVTTTAVASATQLSVTGDRAMTETNTKKALESYQHQIVDDGETYFLLLTVTTGASCDVALQGAVVWVKRAAV